MPSQPIRTRADLIHVLQKFKCSTTALDNALANGQVRVLGRFEEQEPFWVAEVLARYSQEFLAVSLDYESNQWHVASPPAVYASMWVGNGPMPELDKGDDPQLMAMLKERGWILKAR
jgi:hypothetical protein